MQALAHASAARTGIPRMHVIPKKAHALAVATAQATGQQLLKKPRKPNVITEYRKNRTAD